MHRPRCAPLLTWRWIVCVRISVSISASFQSSCVIGSGVL
jgi:hypothetical protein